MAEAVQRTLSNVGSVERFRMESVNEGFGSDGAPASLKRGFLRERAVAPKIGRGAFSLAVFLGLLLQAVFFRLG